MRGFLFIMAKHLFKKGYTPWNKGKKGLIRHNHEGVNNPFFGKKHTAISKEKMRKAKLGKIPSNIDQLINPTVEQENRRINSLMGKKASMETRKKLSESHKGSKSYLWRGGITEANHKIRRSMEYRIWRSAVFMRDNFTCTECGERGGKLNAHHIKPFSLYPELRFAIDNGKTMCITCHMKTETWGRRSLYGRQ